MALTVAELTEIPYLRTTLRAGAAGAGSPVNWAHVCDVERPWEWLERGDLLLTAGASVPEDPEAQVAYVARMAASGISGVAVGENMHAPPLSAAMLAAADEHALPILSTSYEISWTQVVRAVAAANRGQDQAGIVAIARLYEQVRIAARESWPSGVLVRRLGKQLGCELTIVDLETGEIAVPNLPRLDQGLLARVLDELRARDSRPERLARVTIDGAVALALHVPTRHPTAVVAVSHAERQPALRLLEHVATLAALEVDRVWSSRESERRHGQELFAALLDGRVAEATGRGRLARHGLSGGQLAIVAVAERGETGDRWHRWLVSQEVAHLLLPRQSVLYALLPATDRALRAALRAQADWLPAGVSDGFGDVSRIQDAVREARWALDAATDRAVPTARYGDDANVFGARSIKEAQDAVDRILAPVLTYDRDRATELVRSLAAFLRHNRSWQNAAAELYVHKQTLVYRMRRVEELTGRSLSHVDDVVELWLALRALALLGGDDGAPPPA
jgi:purine catabolism regulator